MFNIRYYPVPRINKDTYQKELQCLVEIVVLTTIPKCQYGTNIFIIPKKEGIVRVIKYY